MMNGNLLLYNKRERERERERGIKKNRMNFY